MSIFKRKIPTPRQPLDLAPDRSGSILKAARRQAYRYGHQLRSLGEGSDDYNRIKQSWQHFLEQFDDGTVSWEITRNYLTLEFNRGVQEYDMQTKENWALV